MILTISDVRRETDTEVEDILPNLLTDGYQEGIIPKFERAVLGLILGNEDDIDEGIPPVSIGLEGKELATLLMEEYGNKSVSPECKRMVLEFIANNESVLDQDVEFVKTLTKAAHKIHKADPYSLDNLLERVYQFNLEGISLIHLGKANKFSENRVLRMRAHLYSHGGYFSKAVFDAISKKEDVSWEKKVHWAKEWYRLYMLSTILSEDFDQRHSAHACSWAADGARAVFYIINKREDVPTEEKMEWAERWYEARSLAADKSMEFDQKHAANSYRNKADVARILFYKTRDIHYAIEAIDGYIKFMEYYGLNRELITPQIDQLIKRCKTNLSRLEKELNLSPQVYCVLT